MLRFILGYFGGLIIAIVGIIVLLFSVTGGLERLPLHGFLAACILIFAGGALQYWGLGVDREE